MRGLSGTIAVDVFVVGLGPAGACAAAAAAQAGLNVLAIDKKKEPGLPVQCAEFVPSLIGQETSALNVSTRQAISHMETYVDSVAKDITPDFRGTMISRAAFDKALVARAAASGAQCCFDESLAEISPSGVGRLRSGAEIRSKVMIGADGPRSRLGGAIGSVNSDCVESRQITVRLLQPHLATDIFLSADLPGGYGWLFPNGATANLGLGVAPHARNVMKPALDELHQRLVREARVGPEVLSYTGGPIPVGGMVKPQGLLGAVPVMLAGDAAGLANPVTGAGINAAVVSGRMAGEAAATFIQGHGVAIDAYEEQLCELFEPSLQRAIRRRTELMKKFVSNSRPTAADLRKAWIAYPEYWAA
jgi:digeranylgeranylglycerophospholipid reductase